MATHAQKAAYLRRRAEDLLYISVGGQGVRAKYAFAGIDDLGTGWPNRVTGNVAASTGAGSDPSITATAFRPPASQGANFNGTVNYYVLSDTAEGDFGTGDLYCEIAWVKNGTGVLHAKRTTAAGMIWYIAGSGRLVFHIQDSGGNVDVQTGVLSDTDVKFNSACCDRDDTTGLRMFGDGSQVDTDNPSARTGSLTNAVGLSIGAYGTGGTPSASVVAWCAAWEAADLWPGGASNTAAMLALHQQRRALFV